MVRISSSLVDDMIGHARDYAPAEACGLVAGRDGQPVKVYKLRNAEPEATRNIRYLIEPRDQLRALREMDDENTELFAIFHSHPATQAYPSATDVARSQVPDTGESLFPDTYYIIVSLQNPAEPVVRAFKILDGKIEEHPVEVV
ncbi:MAG: M67 family metallopeptidase [Chloroflexi bacterium]|nr:M67 family metallopeptidase [Chloroflexota bacterium]